MSLKIYIDMDGVIADFVKGFEQEYGFKPDGNIDEYKENFPYNGFYENLPIYDWTKELIEEAKKYGDVEILTACGKYNPEAVAEQKKRWLEKHNIDLPFNWVRRSKEKSKYANEKTILIDDREKSLKPFVENGGIGIKLCYNNNWYELEKYQK